MILRITVNDNDFTEYLEQFAKDLELRSYYCKLIRKNKFTHEHYTDDESFRQLFYNTDKYTPALAGELCERVRENWENFVNYVMKDHDYWDDFDKIRIREALIKDFKVKFQKSLTPKWENGEVVYICCGYHNKWWTF
jgi:hypothetical protein